MLVSPLPMPRMLKSSPSPKFETVNDGLMNWS